VNEFGRAAAGPGRKIVAFDERCFEPAAGRVEGDPSTGRAAADDKNVERFVL